MNLLSKEISQFRVSIAWVGAVCVYLDGVCLVIKPIVFVCSFSTFLLCSVFCFVLFCFVLFCLLCLFVLFVLFGVFGGRVGSISV